jgi:hypothetical protein
MLCSAVEKPNRLNALHYNTCATGDLFAFFFTASHLSVCSDKTECYQRLIRCFYRTRSTAASWEHSHVKCIATVVYGKIIDSVKRPIRCRVNELLRRFNVVSLLLLWLSIFEKMETSRFSVIYQLSSLLQLKKEILLFVAFFQLSHQSTALWVFYVCVVEACQLTECTVHNHNRCWSVLTPPEHTPHSDVESSPWRKLIVAIGTTSAAATSVRLIRSSRPRTSLA